MGTSNLLGFIGRAAVLITGLVLLGAPAARASCGLTFCPRPEEPGVDNLEFGLMAKESGFDLHGTSGSYTELRGNLQYTAWGRLVMGLHLPFILLHASGTEAGFGNAMAFVEYRARPSWLSAFGAGVQLEFPTGAADHGLADDHYMAVPYLSLAAPAGPLMAGGALGLATTFLGNHDHGQPHAGHVSNPVYVQPHESFEFLYRLSAGARLLGGKFLPEAFMDGQRVLKEPEDPDAGMDFLNLGVSLPFQLKALLFTPNFAVPVFPDHRFEWSAGLSVGWKLGLGAKKGAYGET